MISILSLTLFEHIVRIMGFQIIRFFLFVFLEFLLNTYIHVQATKNNYTVFSTNFGFWKTEEIV